MSTTTSYKPFTNAPKRNKDLFPYEIYTDGAAKGHDPAHNCGGWAYVIVCDGKIVRSDSGTVYDTTNQRMELTAALEALKACDILWNEQKEYNIFSDSAYFINCYEQQWWRTWIQNGWRNSAKKDVANTDLWSQIIPYFQKKSFHFFKVKGHADNQYNNLADKMAQEAATPWRKFDAK